MWAPKNLDHSESFIYQKWVIFEPCPKWRFLIAF